MHVHVYFFCVLFLKYSLFHIHSLNCSLFFILSFKLYFFPHLYILLFVYIVS
nr:MAG TPA: hypothetical protein [Bacteriophage sp.]